MVWAIEDLGQNIEESNAKCTCWSLGKKFSDIQPTIFSITKLRLFKEINSQLYKEKSVFAKLSLDFSLSEKINNGQS